MPVVVKYGKGHPDFSGLIAPKGINARSRVDHLSATIPIASGDSSTSEIFFGRVPSNARILPSSSLAHTAITGLTSFHMGLKYGSTKSAACLASALNLATAGGKAANAAVSVANLERAAWELMGLASDPGGLVDVVGTFNADATAAGAINLSLSYVAG